MKKLLFMRPVPNDMKILTSKYSKMNIEELNAYIKDLEGCSDCANQLRILDIAKTELELKYKTERRTNRTPYSISQIFTKNRKMDF